MEDIIINLDLNQNFFGEKTVDIFQLSAKIQRNFLGVRKEVDMLWSSIAIENLVISSEIELLNTDSFITIKSKSLNLEKNTSHKNVRIQTNDVDFTIVIDLSKIEDIGDNSNNLSNTKSYPVSFQVVLIPTNQDERTQVLEYTLQLSVTPEKAQLGLNYENLTNAIEYKSDLDIHLMNIVLQKNNRYKFHFLDYHFEILPRKKDIQRGETLTINYNGNISSELYNKGEYKIPVSYKMNAISNPHTTLAIKRTIDCKISSNGRVNIAEEIPITFDLLPSSNKTEMKVEVKGGEYKIFRKDFLIASNLQWLGSKKTGKANCFELKISNLADNGDGFIKIKNLSIVPEILEGELVPLKQEVDETERNSIFIIEPVLEKDSELILYNNQESHQEISVGFRHDSISSIPSQKVKFQFKISFDYSINEKGAINTEEIKRIYACQESLNNNDRCIRLEINDSSFCESCPSNNKSSFLEVTPEYTEFSEFLSEYLKFNKGTNSEENNSAFKHFENSVFFTIEENTGEFWLALDFGTSASVAAFADPDQLNRGREEEVLIKMQDSLLNLYKSKKKLTFSENNPNFISSEVLLRSSFSELRTYLDAEKYQNDIVHISPSKDELNERSKYRIPYLKSLIGFKEVPDLNQSYGDFTYYLDKSHKTPIRFDERPLLVNEVLKNVYNSFLRDFIKPQLENVEGLDKIIISIPNTFTPKHIENIKSIIVEYFKEFRQDYIEFISESDAVACNYLANWNNINYNRPDKHQIRNQEEYVMVYDMGAGTTDITMFKLSKLKKGKRELNVIGKLGKSTAGNYLDFVIAQIIDETKKLKFNYTLEHNKDSVKPYAIKLKSLIREIIKPNLNKGAAIFSSPDGDFYIKGSENFNEISTEDIRTHPLMKVYLKENSKDLFKQFFHLYNGTDPAISSKKKSIKIDTVIFTGRGILFDDLRNKIQDELTKNWITSNCNTHFVFNNKEDQLKSVVVRGAMNYALKYRNPKYSPVQVSSRNIMARYGFLYEDVHTGDWQFLEVLNPSTKALNKFPNRVNGVSVYMYDSEKNNALGDVSKMFLDLSGTTIGYFVQSFSSTTAQDVNEKNWDYVTVMFSFNKSSVTSPESMNNVKVRVKVSKENEMIVKIGSFEEDPKAPLRMELTNNQTFQKSLWPYV